MARGITLGTPKLNKSSLREAGGRRDAQPIYQDLTGHLETLESHHRNVPTN